MLIQEILFKNICPVVESVIWIIAVRNIDVDEVDELCEHFMRHLCMEFAPLCSGYVLISTVFESAHLRVCVLTSHSIYRWWRRRYYPPFRGNGAGIRMCMLCTKPQCGACKRVVKSYWPIGKCICWTKMHPEVWKAIRHQMKWGAIALIEQFICTRQTYVWCVCWLDVFGRVRRQNDVCVSAIQKAQAETNARKTDDFIIHLWRTPSRRGRRQAASATSINQFLCFSFFSMLRKYYAIANGWV